MLRFWPVLQNFSIRSLHAMAPLGAAGLKLSVAEPTGLKQIAVRFPKKKPGFDPEPVLQKMKEVINQERKLMKLGEL